MTDHGQHTIFALEADQNGAVRWTSELENIFQRCKDEQGRAVALAPRSSGGFDPVILAGTTRRGDHRLWVVRATMRPVNEGDEMICSILYQYAGEPKVDGQGRAPMLPRLPFAERVVDLIHDAGCLVELLDRRLRKIDENAESAYLEAVKQTKASMAAARAGWLKR